MKNENIIYIKHIRTQMEHDLFLDDNDLNEKSIIGFISFFLMMTFGITDLVTALVWDIDLKVSETIYTSFVVVTLGSFGISEAGKAFGK